MLSARPLVLVVALALVASGCNLKSAEQQAAEALSAGLQAHQVGNVEEAERQYQACLTAEPNNKYCLFNLGVIEQGRGNTFDAANYYGRAIAQDPQFTGALFNLAIIRAADGATDEAISLYRRLIDNEPGNASAHLNLGYLLLAKGDLAGASAEFAAAAAIDPSIVIPSLSPSPPPASPANPSPSPN